ncbi:MAG: thiolase family protein [Deltaproteobacteria bacterium]|nr:thiolase family protein [Myxococcales bacterium]MDP3218372.1 thiolase family protein [Deltaproteobacteria bacterium]
MSKVEVFICSAVRTPIGAFQGSLADVAATRLGATAVKAALERAKVAPEQVGEVYMGNVLTAGEGQAPARQAALYAGLPTDVPCTTVGKVCGSGLMAVMLGAKSIMLGDADVVVAGGMESMSNVPYYLPTARKGMRMGNATAIDGMIHDGLWDPYKNFHMGVAGELCAKEMSFSREAQDAFAKESYRRALAAQSEGLFADELVGVTIEGRKGAVTVLEDDEPRRGDADKMAALKPAFDKAGTITAANASKINDGASALVLASGDAVKRLGLTPLARIVGYGSAAQEPEWFTTAPSKAIAATLKRTGLSVGDIDLFEVNEAFAVVALAVAQKSGLDLAKVNVHGGAVALGHPIGASGARILTTLTHALAKRGAKRGLATLCIGGGEAVAVVIER